jgi:hypothetical protein
VGITFSNRQEAAFADAKREVITRDHTAPDIEADCWRSGIRSAGYPAPSAG